MGTIPRSELRERCLARPDTAGRLGALVGQFPAPSPAESPGFQDRLSLAAECLVAACREIQRSVRTPISLTDSSILSDLIRKVSDLLAADGVAAALGRPVSGPELADAGYRLLDIVNEYDILAGHFFSGEVQEARIERPSNLVEAEIAAVAGKAASLKLEMMEFLNAVKEALQYGPTV